VNFRLVEEIASAVLYEGYILYPYRPSSLKNRQRFNFGVVAPEDESASASGEKSVLQTQCLLRATADATLTVRVRFLQIVHRAVGRLVGPLAEGQGDTQPTDAPVAALDVDGTIVPGWQEAVEREIRVTTLISGLGVADARQRGQWPAEDDVEPLQAADGRTVGAIIRRKEMVDGELQVSGSPIGDRLFKITVRVSNVTPATSANDTGRDGWLMRSLVSTHAILQIDGGEFLSLVDPPADAREQAESCRQIGLWPVLVGDPSDRDALLAAPIILYDHPQIAPESAGDFCDGTEIDEMLALRILTMTDDEKLEMRQGDERGRRMLERTESLSDEHMMRLHGVLRGLRSLDDGGAR
jgi:hypothetical protein